jgi:hypothetical protein
VVIADVEPEEGVQLLDVTGVPLALIVGEAPHGVLAGVVGVVEEDQRTSVRAQQPELLGGDRLGPGGDGVGDSCRVAGDGVELALADRERLAVARARSRPNSTERASCMSKP